MLRSVSRPALLALLVLLFAPLRLISQAKANLHGVVLDPSGSPVAHVRLALVAPHGAAIAHSVTSARGEFNFPSVSEGSYELTLPATAGFAAVDKPLLVRGAVPDIRVILQPAEVTETIDVASGQPLSASAAANQDTVSLTADSLRALPVFDQDIVSTIAPFLDPASTSTSGVSLVVDGVEMPAGAPISPSAIAEVRVNADPYSVEFASPGRGRIEITTKPGSPHFHGELNFLIRDAALNARSYFAPVRPPERRRIYEGHLTGPVGHAGHTTFLITGQRKDDEAQSPVHALTPSGLIDENWATPNYATLLSGRITHDFSDAHRLAVNYAFQDYRHLNSNVGGLTLPEAGLNTNNRNDSLTFNDRILVSPHLVQQLMFVFEKEEETDLSVTQAPSIVVQGAFTGGGAQLDLERGENNIKLSEVVSWTHAKHYVRFGVSIPQIGRRAFDDRQDRMGTFNYLSLAAYPGTPSSYSVQTGPGRAIYWANEIGAFAQDEISFTPRLQITFGLRYQWQTYISDLDCFSPRTSFGYAPGKNWVVRGGAGVFYDRTGGDFPVTFGLHNGIAERQYLITNPGPPSTVPAGAALAALPSGIVREDPALRAPYQLQYSVSAERKLGGLTATAGYRGITGVASFRSRDANAPLPPFYTTRPNPAFGEIQQIESRGRTRSNALELGLRGKAGQWFAGQALYTFSHNNANTGGINWFPQDQYSPNEWGRASLDRRHRFDLLGTVHPDHWLNLGIGLWLFSGAPYNELAGADPYNTGLDNARPAGVARNTLQGAGVATVDLSWAHDFHLNHAKGENAKVLHLAVSSFNALNHPKFTSYVGTVTSPLFRQPVTADTGRQMQFELGYQF